MNAPRINANHAMLGALVMVTIGATGLNWTPTKHAAQALPVITEEAPTMFGDDPRFDQMGISRFTLRARADEVDAWLAQLDVAACPTTLRAIAEHPAPQLRHRWVSTLFQRWASADLRGARVNAQSIAAPELRRTALEAVIQHWPDFTATWAWWQGLQDDSTADLVLDAVIAQHLPHNPVLVANHASQMSDPFQRQRALEKVSYAWTGLDEKAALSWALQQRTPGIRELVLVPPLRALCAQDAIAGFRVAEREFQPAARRAALIEAFAAIGHFGTPATLLSYVSFTDDMQPAMRVLGQSRAANSPANAIDLAARLPEGALRDAFLLGAAEQLSAIGKAKLITPLLEHCGPGAELEEMRLLAGR
jgi:hypothetical protein